MRDFDLTTLRLFVRVCETGNISRAGEQANIVGSAISKRLAQLEEQVGTALLVRRRHGVAPTQAGQTLLEHARAMLDGAARLERDMQAYVTGGRWQVRVLASVSAMSEWLADDIAAFLNQDAHRAVRVDLEERVSPEIVRGVREGHAALGVCWDATDHGGLQVRPYRTDRLCVALPPGHRLADRPALRYADTLDDEQVSLPVNSAAQLMLQRHAAALGRSVQHRIVVTNFDAALRVVRAGLAISVMPREVAQTQASAVGVPLVPLDEPWAERRFIICHRGADTLSPAAQMLVDHLAAQAPP